MGRRRSQRTREHSSLQELELFRGCSNNELDACARLMTPVAVPSDFTVCRDAEPGREFFVIADGVAEVRRGDDLIALLGPGDFFGEMALLDGGPRTATVVAATDLDVYVSSEREFRSMLCASPTVTRHLLVAVSQRLRRAA